MSTTDAPDLDLVPAVEAPALDAAAIEEAAGEEAAGEVCLSPDIIAADIVDRVRPGRWGTDEVPWLTIAEVAEQTGVTAHTLRYYERIGLLDVPRDRAGRRRYTEAEVGRVVFITRLRLTAMPIRDIQAYFRLVAEGPGTERQRLELLERHRASVVTRLTDLQSALSVIDFKIALYGGKPS